ncbi:hypothetical protein TCSYLVIO_008836 [Trypanosoma cruzi]|nr:hypothetical protein TCSYLVIO_008836 [Trypanosoma cruzi]
MVFVFVCVCVSPPPPHQPHTQVQHKVCQLVVVDLFFWMKFLEMRQQSSTDFYSTKHFQAANKTAAHTHRVQHARKRGHTRTQFLLFVCVLPFSLVCYSSMCIHTHAFVHILHTLHTSLRGAFCDVISLSTASRCEPSSKNSAAGQLRSSPPFIYYFFPRFSTLVCFIGTQQSTEKEEKDNKRRIAHSPSYRCFFLCVYILCVRGCMQQNTVRKHLTGSWRRHTRNHFLFSLTTHTPLYIYIIYIWGGGKGRKKKEQSRVWRTLMCEMGLFVVLAVLVSLPFAVYYYIYYTIIQLLPHHLHPHRHTHSIIHTGVFAYI